MEAAQVFKTAHSHTCHAREWPPESIGSQEEAGTYLEFGGSPQSDRYLEEVHGGSEKAAETVLSLKSIVQPETGAGPLWP